MSASRGGGCSACVPSFSNCASILQLRFDQRQPMGDLVTMLGPSALPQREHRIVAVWVIPIPSQATVQAKQRSPQP